MGTVLLYNLNDTEKRMKIKLCLYRLGLSAKDVAPEDFGHPLGYLLGLEGFAPAAGEAESFTAEMLVMHALSRQQFSALLDALRQARVPVKLKAVVTETNLAWSSAQLCRELAAEHAAMQSGRGAAHRPSGK